MARRPSVIAELVEESSSLDQLAKSVQGDREVEASSGEIDRLIGQYQGWLARALNALPEEYHERFRDEYAGGVFTSKIKTFLEQPTEVSLLYSTENDDGSGLIPYWQHPYETAFHAPLLAQRQILMEAQQKVEGAGTASADIQFIERVCRGFPEFLGPLASRGRDRAPFVVEDEYDVQVLMHALLRLFFDDVRPEDPSPTKAGASSRLDFLLKAERIVVETKMTRQGLRAKEVGEELIIDVERYRAHPDCGALIALVYDPDKRINNRRGLEEDLSGTRDGLVVRVLVVQG